MTKVVFASGQSNMMGRGTGGPDPSSASSLVTVWNNGNELGVNGTAFISPPTFGNNPWSQSPFATGNNLSVWFCHRLAIETGESVKLVLCGKGGTAIDEGWDKDTGTVYPEILDVWAATGLTEPADIFLWHQGDGSTDTSGYTSSWQAMRLNLISDGILSADTACVLGECRASAETANPKYHNIAATTPNCYVADQSGLRDYDGIHFTGNSLYQFGYERYWAAYARHRGPKTIIGASFGMGLL
jgi:hypothetical protein